MLQSMTLDDLENYARGAAFLGSGGGGNPSYGLMIAKNQLEQFGPVPIISIDSLKDDDLIVPLEFMGAPLVGREKLPSIVQFEKLVACIEDTYQKPIKAFCVAEIGGANALVPFYVAGKLKKPVVDGDLIGRAFPELQMISTHVLNIPPTKTFLADAFGNTVILNCSDFNQIEHYARQLTIAFGSRAACSLQVLNGIEARKGLLPNTLSKALKIGRSLITAREEHNLEKIFNDLEFRYIGKGVVTDINQTIEKGFSKGVITIENSQNKNSIWKIELQNEYLFVVENDQIIAETPDIITLLETETLTPLTSESIFFGASAYIVSAKAADLWYTPSGLGLVGPAVFKTQTCPLNNFSCEVPNGL